MESHGGNVELLGLEDDVARIRLEGSCKGCAASASTLELAIKSALEEAAPDLEGIEVEGTIEQPPMPELSGIELPVIQVDTESAVGQAPRRSTAPAAAWFSSTESMPHRGQARRDRGRWDEARVAEVEGSLLAYLDACAGCGEPLREGELTEGVLACPGCERRYFLPRAGRSLDDDRLQLGPVPLLREGAPG